MTVPQILSAPLPIVNPVSLASGTRVRLIVPPASQWAGKRGVIVRTAREGFDVRVDGDKSPLPLFFERGELEVVA